MEGRAEGTMMRGGRVSSYRRSHLVDLLVKASFSSSEVHRSELTGVADNDLLRGEESALAMILLKHNPSKRARFPPHPSLPPPRGDAVAFRKHRDRNADGGAR